MALSRGDRGERAHGVRVLPLSAALAPLSLLYGGVVALRRRAYTAGLLRVVQVDVPVISVGGLTLGGSGKTPVTRFLADQLTARGIRVGVVHGGYLGQAHHRVSCLDPSLRWRAGAARAYGDEAVLLAGWLEDSIVTCGADKLEAARLAVRQGAELIVVDDGFQHLRLHRDLDILLVSGGGAARTLPAGRGREFASAASHAHLLWGVDRGDGQAGAGGHIASSLRSQQLLRGDGTVLGSASTLSGTTVYLLAGIARPEAFASVVSDLGARIIGRTFVRDHRPFSSAQFRAAARSGADLILCTEKDAARMWGHPEADTLTALTCTVEIRRGRSLLERQLAPLVQGIANV